MTQIFSVRFSGWGQNLTIDTYSMMNSLAVLCQCSQAGPVGAVVLHHFSNSVDGCLLRLFLS